MTEYEFVHHQGCGRSETKPASIWGNGCIAIVVRDAEGYWPDYHERDSERMALRGPYPTEEGARHFLYNLGAVQDALETTP